MIKETRTSQKTVGPTQNKLVKVAPRPPHTNQKPTNLQAETKETGHNQIFKETLKADYLTLECSEILKED